VLVWKEKSTVVDVGVLPWFSAVLVRIPTGGLLNEAA